MRITPQQLENVHAHKTQMEHEINRAIAAAMKTFRLQTGLQVSGIDVDVIDVGSASDPGPVWEAGKVTAEVGV